MKSAILILSHCGLSFVETLVDEIEKQGFASVILSSQPLKNAEVRYLQLEKLAKRVIMTDHSVLEWQDVEIALRQLQTHYTMVACISVWEGYRPWMAKANLQLGAPDITAEQVNILRDKYLLRKKLYQLGLSQVTTQLLTADIFAQKKMQASHSFIKPRFGIASFGTFHLRQAKNWQKIIDMRTLMANDREYCSLFNQTMDFIIEDYIPGREHSFEIIIHQNQLYIIAIHEKIDLEETATSVLESACVSPPIHLTQVDIMRAYQQLSAVGKALGLSTGCYHIEARLHDHHWEIIEINPRIGGAFMAQSVEILTGGHNLLGLWLKCLLVNEGLQTLLFSLSTQSATFYLRKLHTFFRVYFAKSSGTVCRIKVCDLVHKPYLTKLLVTKGLKVPDTAREFFLGQALWKIDTVEMEKKFCQILEESKLLLEVTYESTKQELLVDH